MHRSGPRLSLNCMRVFEAAARFRSLKAAAAELGVTPSAVSHQVRQLETNLGVRLFLRHNSGVDLTEEGARLFHGVETAITTILRAQENIRKDAAHVTLRVSASFAYRWLIPRLYAFRRDHPKVSVRLETSNPPNVLDPGVDIAIRYSRKGTAEANAVRFLSDRVRPVVSPILTSRARRTRRSIRIDTTSLLSAADDDWDWREWAATQGIPFNQLRITDRFDIDHAALEACAAGMGIFLATDSLIHRELRSGALVPIDGYEGVHLGDYWMHTASPRREAVQKMATWLTAAAEGADDK